jgi:hypothetical protein
VEITVTSRCVASKSVLVVGAANDDAVAATVALNTPYGAKTLAGVAPDTRASASFSTRLGAMPAGQVTAEITAVVDGETIVEERTVDYGTRTCGLG